MAALSTEVRRRVVHACLARTEWRGLIAPAVKATVASLRQMGGTLSIVIHIGLELSLTLASSRES